MSLLIGASSAVGDWRRWRL